MTQTMGRCLCGALRYRVGGRLSSMMHCHCSMCRKHHGAAFATYLIAEELSWLAGESSVRGFPSSPGTVRKFCRTCGAKAPAPTPNAGHFVPAGNLTDDPGIRPEMHIFVDSKAPWYDITDRVPQHVEYPPGSEGRAEQRPERGASSDGSLAGSCLCGAVRYELAQALLMMYCHCSRCRQGRSAAHAANVFVAAEHFRWLSGEDRVTVYNLPGAPRFGINFCATCGGCVPRPTTGGRMVVPAGSLDNDPNIRAEAHIFVASKAPWFDITDTRPQFGEAPP